MNQSGSDCFAHNRRQERSLAPTVSLSWGLCVVLSIAAKSAPHTTEDVQDQETFFQAAAAGEPEPLETPETDGKRRKRDRAYRVQDARKKTQEAWQFK